MATPRLADGPNSPLHSKIVAFHTQPFPSSAIDDTINGGTAKSAVVWKAVRFNARAAFLLRGATGISFVASMA
jgi:hypothetical protein